MSTKTPMVTTDPRVHSQQLQVWDSAATGHGPYLVRATLAGGLRVAVRPLRTSDRGQLAAGMGHLSEHSRHQRFLGAKPSLNARELDLLVDGVDQHRHVAVALVWPRTSCSDIVLGVAHAFRLSERPDTADVSVTVVDELQGQGAGRLLMSALADASVDRGIKRFTALLLPSNAACARLITGLGTVDNDGTSQGVRDLTVVLSSCGGARDGGPAAQQTLDPSTSTA